MEDTKLVENWQKKIDVSGFSGSGYIEWSGLEYFAETNYGHLDYRIKISTPGTYQLKWYSRVGKGTDVTLHNDTWVKIDGALDYYGKRSDDHIVHPGGVCTNDCPNGTSLNGYFKVWGAQYDSWTWGGFTSDSDPHDVYALFQEPGYYTIKIAARSSYHLIDKMVLFNVEAVTLDEATSSDTPFSEKFPFDRLNDTILLKNSILNLPIKNIHNTVNSIEIVHNNAALIDSVNVAETVNSTSEIYVSLLNEMTGEAQITLDVIDQDDYEFQYNFYLTVIDKINNAPTIDQHEDVITDFSAEEQILTFTGVTDGDNGEQNLSISYSLSPSTVIKITEKTYINDTVVFKYRTKASGVASLKVIVSDNGGTLLGGIDMVEMNFNIRVEAVTQNREGEINIPSIYPNPAINHLTVCINPQELQPKDITIINQTGQILLSEPLPQITADRYSFDLDRLASGEYFLKLITDNKVVIKKFIIK